MASESPSSGLNELITKLKSSMVSLDTQNVTKTLVNNEKRLKTQNLDLIKHTQVLEKENKKLSELVKKRDKKVKILEKENAGLGDEVKELKKVNGACLNKVRVYEKMVLDYDVRVSGLEKLGKELAGSVDFAKKNKNGVVVGCVAETSKQHMSSEKEESKQGFDEKFPETIHIDDDDEDGDDDRLISTLMKKKLVTKEISESNNDQANKIPTEITTTLPGIQTGIQQMTSHSASPFLDSESDEEKIKETYEPIVDKQKERQRSAGMRIESETRRKQISSEKGESQKRTNQKLPDIIQIDDAEDKDENDQTDVLALKRKRCSSNVIVEDDSDEERCASILRRKYASKELQSNDHAIANVRPTGGQPLNKVKVTEKHTERWETEAEMIIEFGKSYELCMNAVCALHRQNIYVGAYLLPRINRLAELLTDGDPERKLKKTPLELGRFELDQCRMFAGTYSAELFKVYQENADPFFPPRC